MKIGTRLGIFGSMFLLAAFGLTASASAHPRALAASGLFAPQQEEHPDDKKPEVNPPAHPQAQDEKKPEHPEDAKPPEHDAHPANAKPEEKPKPAEKETNANRTTKETTKTQTATHTNVHYTVTSKNVTVIKTHYREQLGHIDRAHRPHWVVGGFIDRGQVTYIEPVPAEVIVGFPAVPAGFVWGYWEGYCIVYDPNTLEIVYVVDLI